MLPYNRYLKPIACTLRSRGTKNERLLWSRLHSRQLLGAQFYRQKPLGPYIVDFYCSSANLIVELDGEYHKDPNQSAQDEIRDSALNGLGLRILRFDNGQVEHNLDNVIR